MTALTQRRRFSVVNRCHHSITHRCFSLTVLLVFCLFPACGARRTPDLVRIFEAARARQGKRPIIVIPGILGSELVNRTTGELVWVSALRTKGDGLSLPISPDLSANRDELVPRDIVRRARFAPVVPEVYVYEELLGALENYAGYREVAWEQATPADATDTFFVFAYDWRRDNVETARELLARMDELKRRLGQPDLRFNIVAHSMGGLVARYAAMYGAADLPADDAPPVVTWAGAASINRVFMFGTPNEGTMEAFATLLGGYSITEGLRRRIPLLNKLSRDDAFTIQSLYQLLPHAHAAEFLDRELKPFRVDLYDAATWRRYGWSTAENASGFADEYLAAVLRRARRFHEALDATSARDAPVSFYVFGGDCEETLARPVIVRDEKQDRWLTFTEARRFRGSYARGLKRSDIIRQMYEPGDGRVTRRSLLAERLDAVPDSSSPYAVFACDLHGDVQKNKTLQDNALTVLVAEAMK